MLYPLAAAAAAVLILILGLAFRLKGIINLIHAHQTQAFFAFSVQICPTKTCSNRNFYSTTRFSFSTMVLSPLKVGKYKFLCGYLKNIV